MTPIPYTRIAVTAAYSSFGPGRAAGIALYTARLDGASLQEAAIADAIAGGSSYAFGEADAIWGDSIPGIAAHGVIGGTSAELQGGNFLNGFAISAGTKCLTVAAIKMREAMLAQSDLNPENSSGTSAGFRGDGRKLGGVRCIVNVDCAKQYPSPLGGIQGGKGSLFQGTPLGFTYDPGSFADLFVEAYAGPHDFLNSPYWYNTSGNARNFNPQGSLYGEFLNGVGEVYSAGNILIATPFVAASVIPSSAYIPLLGK